MFSGDMSGLEDRQGVCEPVFVVSDGDSFCLFGHWYRRRDRRRHNHELQYSTKTSDWPRPSTVVCVSAVGQVGELIREVNDSAIHDNY